MAARVSSFSQPHPRVCTLFKPQISQNLSFSLHIHLKVDRMQIQLDKLKLHSVVMAIRLVLRHFAWEGGGGQGIEQETTMSANK